MGNVNPRDVGARLRALYAEMSMPSVDAFAELLGVERNRASNWLNAQNLPKPIEMARLCEITGVTLDWIYRGLSNTLPLDKSIRLQALLDEPIEGNRAAIALERKAGGRSSRKKAAASD